MLTVAHALETQKTVSGDDVIAVIEGQEGPLIDGRAYDSDDALGRLEDYHAKAVAAHRTSSRVKGSLPDLPVFSAASAASPAEGNGEVAQDAAPISGDGQRSEPAPSERPEGER